MAKLVLKKSTSKSDELDYGSVLLLQNLFFKNGVKERLERGGNLPMIDGYLELLNNEEVMEAKITVQVKHLTYQPIGSDAYYDIPNEVFAYADLNRGEVVIFVACDTDNDTFYWRYIDSYAIQSFINLPKENQETQRHHFTQYEKCDKDSLSQTLTTWKKIFDQKMASIKDGKYLAEQFAEEHRAPFSKISSLFSDLPESHITRREVGDLVDWINSPSTEGNSNLCVLQGQAGVGKSVVIKKLIEELDKQQVKVLCIKADSLNMMSKDMWLDKLIDHIQYLKSDLRNLVVIIDQIDALSQYFSNDRDKINMFVTLISRLKDYRDVRIVVSCRKYDLEYENNLKSLFHKAHFVDLGKLHLEDVKRVLELLNTGLDKQIGSQTIELLQTANLLNLFCLVYRRNSHFIKFNNAHHLYDEFWRLLVKMAPDKIEASEVEGILFKTAESALNQKTLSPIISVDSYDERILEYLASNNAIVKHNNSYTFFHQSFYEYTLARLYTQNGESFFEQIQKDFQGIEIRSIVKSVLEYEREHSLNQYSKDLHIIFHSYNIRLHIKLLVLSLIASSDTVYDCERQLISEICSQDEKLLSYFLRGIQQDKWFTTLENTVLPYIKSITLQSELLYPITNYLSCASFNYPKVVFDNISLNNDDDVKRYMTNFVLRGHNDYNRAFVRDALLSSNLDSHFFIDALLDALHTNKSFVLTEAKKLVKSYLQRDKKQEIGHDAYMIVDVLCKKLAEEHPRDFINVFHPVFIDIIRTDSKEHYIPGFSYYELLSYDISDYDRTLINLYKSRLSMFSNEESTVKTLVPELLDTKNESAVCIAFEIMAMNPCSYNEWICNVLCDYDMIDSFLHSDIEYYFLILLRNWYLLQDANHKSSYEKLILNYKSKKDGLTNKARNYDRRPYPFIGYNKWKLISVTIPESINNADVNRARQELNRRYYNKPYELKKPDHRVYAAEVCGGSLKEQEFKKLSFQKWLELFAIDEHKYFDRKPIDIRVNAEHFKKCVSNEPDRFRSFVFGFFENESIKTIYKIAGIKGLLEGGIEITLAWSCVKQFVHIEFVKSNPHDFKEIIQHYFNSDNEYLDELVPFLKSAVILPDEDNHKDVSMPGIDELEKGVNSMLTKALNSHQGICVDLITKLCGIEQRKALGYQIINEIESRISEDVRLFAIYKTFDPRNYDENLTKTTFEHYIKRLPVELLYICTQAIQYYWYNNSKIVEDYIDRIQEDVRTHKLLSEIYFYGLTVPNMAKENNSRLERLLSLNEEDVIADIVKICLKNYKDVEYRPLCEQYLKRFSNDGREKVIHTYCWNAKELPEDAFDLFIDVYSCFKANKYREVLDELKYIQKCVIRYPRECLDYIQSRNYENCEYPHFVDEEITEILLMIYKRLNEAFDTDTMNSLMNTFEELLYSGNSTIVNKIAIT